MLNVYIRPTIYLLLIIIIIILFYCCYHNRTKTKPIHEYLNSWNQSKHVYPATLQQPSYLKKQRNTIYETPNQLTAHTAKALVLSCMDFRLIDDEVYFFNKIGYGNNYDKVILAGASLGYNQKTYPEWSKMLDKHIQLSIELHKIDEIIVLEHMGCGEYKLTYPESKTIRDELAKHKENVQTFKEHINKKFPTLTVRAIIMTLDGNVIKL